MKATYFIPVHLDPEKLLQGYLLENDETSELRFVLNKKAAEAMLDKPVPRTPLPGLPTCYGRQHVEYPIISAVVTVEVEDDKLKELQSKERVLKNKVKISSGTLKDCEITAIDYTIGPDILHTNPTTIPSQTDDKNASSNELLRELYARQLFLQSVQRAIERTPPDRREQIDLEHYSVRSGIYDAFSPNGLMNEPTNSHVEMHIKNQESLWLYRVPIDVAIKLREFHDMVTLYYKDSDCTLPEMVRAARAVQNVSYQFQQNADRAGDKETATVFKDIQSCAQRNELTAWENAYREILIERTNPEIDTINNEESCIV